MTFIIRPDGSEVDGHKFKTCKHRSLTEENYTVKTCCKRKTVKGFVCNKLQIKGLSPIQCVACGAYEEKTNG